MADQLDILMRLVASDAATPAINKVSQSVNKLDESTKRGSKGIRDIGQASKETRFSLTQLDSAIGGAVSAFAGLAVLQMASQMRAHGEEVRKTTNTYNALTGGIEQASSTLALLRERTRGLVSDTELMAGAAQLLKTGLAGSNGEAVKLLGLATDLGASTQELFSVLANQSLEVLDSFGVASGAVRELKNEFVAAGMSSEEAFKEAFLIEAEKTVERLGDSINDNISPSDQLSVRWTNFWDTQSKYAATTLNTAITAAEQLVFILDHEVNAKIDEIRASQGLAPINEAFFVDPASLAPAVDPYAARLQSEQQAQAQQQFASLFPGFQMPDVENLAGGAGGALEGALTRVGEAAEAQRAALEANTRAIESQSAQITSSVESLMGWVPPEERALNNAQDSIRDAYRRSGMTQEEIDAAMLTGREQLPQYLAAGFDPAQAAMRAYGVQDSTPGSGWDAQFVGQREQVPTNLVEMLTGDPEMQTFAAGISSFVQYMGQFSPYNGTNVAPGATLPPPNQNMSQGPFNLPTPWTPMSGFNYASGAQLPPSSQNMWTGPFNLPPSFVPQPAAVPGDFWANATPNTNASGPANYGGMDYSSLPSYEDTQLLVQDVTTIQEQTAMISGLSGMGAWSGLVVEASTQVDTLKQNLDKITSEPQTVELNLKWNQATRDATSQWLFAVLRSNGINLASSSGTIG